MSLTATLKASRPSMSFAQFLFTDARPTYEGTEEIRDQRGDFRRWRVYSMGGRTIDGEVILVPGWIEAGTADALAHQGALAAMIAGKEQVRGVEEEAQITVDAPHTESEGLTGETRALFERIMADKYGR